MLFVLVLAVIISSEITHKVYATEDCTDGSNFLIKIIGLSKKCEECAKDGTCLGKLQPISSHSIFMSCMPGYMKDRRGKCREIVR